MGSAIFGRSIGRLNGAGFADEVHLPNSEASWDEVGWVSERLFCCWRRCGWLVLMALIHCSVLMTFLRASFDLFQRKAYIDNNNVYTTKV